ncbi:hypothetical protein [Actinomadura sp. 3N508]|uniref:hypothetical protein n=1 Tax=Actinomadura sp. 3N508 TaxID=3375153 RepID=UPI0037A8BEB8
MGAVVAAPVVHVAFAAPAAADTWPFNSNFRPDKGNHNYCWSVDTPSSAVRSGISAAMKYMTDSTQADRKYHSSCDLSGAGQTDVVWREEGGTGDSWIGSARCVVKWSNGQCDRYFVRINGALVRDHYSSSTHRNRQYRKTACHELGHTLGLNHYRTWDDRNGSGDNDLYTGSCQRSGWVGTVTSSWIRTWESHHRGHINGWF